ncbi:MAG: anthranilate phosphoribosyltransferase [Alphaproteobacteria bacterium]|nr:anthranilate phosphoribosyltransferase [Alphaproteobacteria bacterium]
MSDLKPYLALVAKGETLSQEEAESAFALIMEGKASDAQIGAFLMGLRLRGESVEEITGAARILRERAETIEAPDDAIDTCGTGGDAKGSFNISTASALVTASCGVPVAKHGNKAQTSKSGSSDVLAALGVNIEAEPALLQLALKQANICFLMAPRHHAAMRHVAKARQEIGTRTIFNLVGPLANPAGAKRQLVGVFDKAWVEPLAHVLDRLGLERAWVVHGSDGMDEITTTGPSYVAELKEGSVSCFEVTPEEAGIARAAPEDLMGGEAEENAAMMRALLDGEEGALRDIVLMNSAAALIIAGRADDLAAGAELAAAAIDEGATRETLEKLVAITNGK